MLHPFHVDASRGLAYGLILQAVEIFDALLLGTLALLREGARRRMYAARDRLRAGGRLLTRRPGA